MAGKLFPKRLSAVRGLLWLLSATALLSTVSLRAAPPAADLRPAPRMALLVGIQTYPNLPPERQLAGSRNDIQAIRGLLTERFGFAAGDVVTLLDAQATSSSIRAELRHLAQRVQQLPASQSPAQVVFYFSGHGSQVPDQEEGDPDCDEEDGLDETIVPYDAVQEGGPQDIRDDEINHFLQAACRGGRARVWVVLDCCHSGSGARGLTRLRQLDRQVMPTPPRSGDKRRVTPKTLPPQCVVLSACRASEVEPEYQDQGRTFGLLTRELVQALQRNATLSTLSYATLRNVIVEGYLRDGITPAPTPQLEGTPDAMRSIVLGASVTEDRRACWSAESHGPDRATVRLAAGVFQGVTAGSLFELYGRPDEIAWDVGPTSGKTSLAWLEARQPDATQTVCQAFRWQEEGRQKQEIDLPPTFRRGVAVERYHQHGDRGATIRVVEAAGNTGDGPRLSPADPALPPAIRMALTTAQQSDESPWLVWAAGEEPCDLLLRFSGRYAAIFPASGFSTAVRRKATLRGALPAALRGGWGPFDLSDASACSAQLQDCLRRIVRGRNLIRAAATQLDTGRPAAIELELVPVKVDSAAAAENATARAAGREATMARVGNDQRFAFRVKNISHAAVYVSVLAIDPDMEIQAVLPVQTVLGGDEERLEAGDDRLSGVYRCTEPFGQHSVIALATAAPNDFGLLAQPGVGRLRGSDTPSPLVDWLFEETSFRTRSGPRPRPPHQSGLSAAMLRWEAVP